MGETGGWAGMGSEVSLVHLRTPVTLFITPTTSQRARGRTGGVTHGVRGLMTLCDRKLPQPNWCAGRRIGSDRKSSASAGRSNGHRRSGVRQLGDGRGGGDGRGNDELTHGGRRDGR